MVKNKLYVSDDEDKYKYYRNKICSLIRLSKKICYQDYFERHKTNMKKTWEGINDILHRRKKTKIITAIKDPNKSNKIVKEPSQYGFRKGHSTQHAILDIVNAIQINMNQGLFSCGVFIDLKKAFDTVSPRI